MSAMSAVTTVTITKTNFFKLLSKDAISIIIEFAAESTDYKLRDWIPLEKLNKGMLCANPCAMHIIETHPEIIDWTQLCRNPHPRAIKILEEHPDKIIDIISINPSATRILEQLPLSFMNWSELSSNPGAMTLLKKHPHLIDWDEFSSNPHPDALLMMLKHLDKVNPHYLSKNTNTDSIQMLQQNLTKYPEFITDFYWRYLSANPHPIALQILEEHPQKIGWEELSSNSNLHALQLLQQNPQKIDGFWLSSNQNPYALQLLQQHPEDICWELLSENPAIFEAYVSQSKKDAYMKLLY